MIRAVGVLAAALSTGCLEGWDLETRAFPCREPSDCLEGRTCDPTRYVCVDGAVDGGAPAPPVDPSAPDAG